MRRMPPAPWRLASRSASSCRRSRKAWPAFPVWCIACSRSAQPRPTSLFVNDSKATNADSAAKALASYADIYWIAGGKPKTGGIESLSEYFPRIRKAYLIGEAAEEFAKTLEGKVPYEIDGVLSTAVDAATRDAAASGLKEAVVLLSPACASFDQYPNFEVRGKAFTDLVLALPGVSSSPSPGGGGSTA